MVTSVATAVREEADQHRGLFAVITARVSPRNQPTPSTKNCAVTGVVLAPGLNSSGWPRPAGASTNWFVGPIFEYTQ